MNQFVLDCSVAMAWCFEDEISDYTESVLERLKENEAIVPSLWALEVTNVLLVAEKNNRITKAQSLHFVELLESLPILIDESTSERAFKEILSLARQHRLSSYDASYLELAMREGLPLATQDSPLRKAAKECGVVLMDG